eukprot:9415661-Alexandrium_andersonii.AAC.1
MALAPRDSPTARRRAIKANDQAGTRSDKGRSADASDGFQRNKPCREPRHDRCRRQRPLQAAAAPP